MLKKLRDEITYRATLFALTVCGMLTVASIAAHYARFCMFGGGQK